MNKFGRYLNCIALMVACIGIAALIVGGRAALPYGLIIGAVAGLCAALEEDGIHLVWQDPKMFQYGGLFLKARNKRYRLYRIGRR